MVGHTPPRLFGRLTATDKTRQALRAEKRVLEDVLDSTKVRHPKNIPKDFTPKTQTSLNTGGEKLAADASTVITENESTVLGVQSSSLQESVSSEQLEKQREAAQYDEEIAGYDFPFSCQSSWASHSFKLWPGEYLLSVYVEESRRVQQGVEKGMKVNQKQRTKNPLRPEERTGETPREAFVEMDLSHKGAWAHLSSVGRFTLNSVSAEEMEENQNMLSRTCLSRLAEQGLPLEEMGPFLADQQHEAGSKGMQDVVARARAQADEINMQLLELTHGKVVSVLMQPPPLDT